MTPPPRHRPIPTAFLPILLVLFGGFAFCQGQITGTMTATLGGEERTWNTLGRETGGRFQNTASFGNIMGDVYDITIQGHPGETFGVENALSITMTLFGLPQDCPCEVTAEALYFTSGSMFTRVYQGEELSLTFTSFEPLDGDTFRAEGSFRGTLVFRESVMAEPDASQTLELEGVFLIARLTRDVRE